jgi:hypothetical protein
MGFGVSAVRGRSRAPPPPARIIAFIEKTVLTRVLPPVWPVVFVFILYVVCGGQGSALHPLKGTLESPLENPETFKL